LTAAETRRPPPRVGGCPARRDSGRTRPPPPARESGVAGRWIGKRELHRDREFHRERLLAALVMWALHRWKQGAPPARPRSVVPPCRPFRRPPPATAPGCSPLRVCPSSPGVSDAPQARPPRHAIGWSAPKHMTELRTRPVAVEAAAAPAAAGEAGAEVTLTEPAGRPAVQQKHRLLRAEQPRPSRHLDLSLLVRPTPELARPPACRAVSEETAPPVLRREEAAHGAQPCVSWLRS